MKKLYKQYFEEDVVAKSAKVINAYKSSQVLFVGHKLESELSTVRCDLDFLKCWSGSQHDINAFQVAENDFFSAIEYVYRKFQMGFIFTFNINDHLSFEDIVDYLFKRDDIVALLNNSIKRKSHWLIDCSSEFVDCIDNIILTNSNDTIFLVLKNQKIK
jgi:hypothetical protein